MASEEMRIAFRIPGVQERVPVCLYDPDGEFQAWFDRYLDLDGSNLFCWQTADAAAGNCRPRTRRPSYSQTFPLHGWWDANRYEYRDGDYPARTGYWDERRPLTPQVGLPVINWPAPPRLKINSLWWPTGATRWAVGLFLVTEAGVRKICDRQSFPIGLEHSVFATADRSETERTINVYPMTPRRVTGTGNGSDLWLLPVVDCRYFWQFKPWRRTTVGYYWDRVDRSFIETADNPPQIMEPVASWLKMFAWALEDLGFISIEGDPTAVVSDTKPNPAFRMWIDTIPEAYRYPDYLEFQRKGVSAAYVLDAVAASLGKRVVVKPSPPISGLIDDPEIWIIGPASSRTVLGRNVAANRSKLIAGGCAAFDWASSNTAESKRFHFDASERPRDISVFFPSCNNRSEWGQSGVMCADDFGLHVQVEELSDGTFDVDATALGNLHGDSNEAHPKNRFRGQKTFLDSGSYAGKNLSLFTALALQIAADYRDAQGYSFDVCYSGIRAWNPSGFDDFVEYNFAVQDGSGEYLCTTRAASLPSNCGVSHLLHLVDITDTADTGESAASGESSVSQSGVSSGESSASSYSGVTTTVTVVTNVWCDDGDIVVQTADLIFDAAGHFLYTENVDPPSP